MDAVRGEWLGFLDSDDAYHPQLLELVKIELGSQEGLDVVSFGHTKTQEAFSQPIEKPVVRQRDFREQVETGYFREALWSRFYHFAVVKDVRFRPYIMAEDTLYSTAVSSRLCKGCVIKAPLYFYRPREGSAMLSLPSLRKVENAFFAKVESLQILFGASSRVPTSFLKRECSQISECIAYELSQLDGVSEFRKRRWQALKLLGKNPSMPCRFRITFTVVGTLRSVFAERLLMELPFRLKLARNWLLHMVGLC